MKGYLQMLRHDVVMSRKEVINSKDSPHLTSRSSCLGSRRELAIRHYVTWFTTESGLFMSSTISLQKLKPHIHVSCICSYLRTHISLRRKPWHRKISEDNDMLRERGLKSKKSKRSPKMDMHRPGWGEVRWVFRIDHHLGLLVLLKCVCLQLPIYGNTATTPISSSLLHRYIYTN